MKHLNVSCIFELFTVLSDGSNSAARACAFGVTINTANNQLKEMPRGVSILVK